MSNVNMLPASPYHDTPVLNFHIAYGHTVEFTPGAPIIEKRLQLLQLLAGELAKMADAANVCIEVRPCDEGGYHIEAVQNNAADQVDLAGCATTLAELRHAIDGGNLVFGFPGARILAEIHASKMSQPTPGQVDPPPFQPPNIGALLGWSDGPLVSRQAPMYGHPCERGAREALLAELDEAAHVAAGAGADRTRRAIVDAANWIAGQVDREREAEAGADIAAGRVHKFPDAQSAIAHLRGCVAHGSAHPCEECAEEMHAAEAPLTAAEIKDLSAMIWGAPCDDETLEGVITPIVRRMEALQRAGARPADPARRRTAWTRDNIACQDLLSLIDLKPIPLEVIEAWTDEECRAAEDYAAAVHLHASDNEDVVIPPKPAHVAAYEWAPGDPDRYKDLFIDGRPIANEFNPSDPRNIDKDNVATCVHCGCTDTHGCATPCYWLAVDRVKKDGVCSNCQPALQAWRNQREGVQP